MKRMFLILFSLLCCFNANAGVDNKLVVNAEKYLNSITGLNGGFTQVSMVKHRLVIFQCCALVV